MNKLIEFYFDFSSPYAYMAANLMDDFAKDHHAKLEWIPFVMGAVIKQEGTQPLLDYPKKGRYSKYDMERTACYYHLDYAFPSKFPINSVYASRGFYWIKQNIGDEAAIGFAKLVYTAYFVEDKDIANKDILVDLACHQGHDGQAFLDGIETPAIKAYLKEITDHAADRGVFGAPFFLIDDEPFWGVDRLSLMGYYLEHGEWPQKTNQ